MDFEMPRAATRLGLRCAVIGAGDSRVSEQRRNFIERFFIETRLLPHHAILFINNV